MQLEIRNYYEVLLMEILSDSGLIDELPEEYLADLCCITLNQLPVRYVRHLVDTYFFEDRQELRQMKNEIQAALEKSRAFLKRRNLARLQEQAQHCSEHESVGETSGQLISTQDYDDSAR